MNRRYVAAAAVMALSALAGTNANAATVAGPMGTADTVVDLADLAVIGLPVDGISIGSVRSFASTDTNPLYNPVGAGKPFAIAKVSLPDGSSTAVRSDGDTGSQGKTVPLAGVGSVTVGDLTATAGGTGAQSLVNAVEGEVNAVVAGLKARAAGVNAKVGVSQSSTTNGAVVENVTIGLTDVLPADLLAQLPLDKIIALVDSLGLNLDLGPLDGAVQQVRALADTVNGVVGTQAKIESAQAEIASLRAAGDSGVADAQKGVDDAQAAVNSANATLIGLNAQHSNLVSQYAAQGCTVLASLPGCAATAAQIASVEGQISSQESVVAAKAAALEVSRKALDEAKSASDNAQARIDALQAEINALKVTLDGLLDQVLDLANKVVKLDLDGVLKALLSGLEGAELISIERMSFGVSTVADASSSKASTLCEISGVRILGRVSTIDDCGAVERELDKVEGALKGVLAALPIKGVVPANLVKVDGPRLKSSPDNYTAEGYRIATAKVSGLDLTVESVTLTQVVDGLVAEARALVSGALETIENALGVEVPVNVDAALEDLLSKLNALPIGDTLDGIKTPRISISAVDVASRSTFRAAGSGVDVVPVGDLPHTGGGFGTALFLLAAAGGVWAAVKPRKFVLEG